MKVDLQTSRPAPALQRFVRLYVQRKLAPKANLHEPVLARLGGLFEFHFAGLYRVPIVGTDRYDRCAPILVVGPISHQRVQLEADGPIEVVMVLFQPHGLYELFGIPTQLLAEHAEEGHAALGRGLTELYGLLGDACDFPARVAVLNKFLFRHADARSIPAGCDWSRAFNCFVRSGETVNVRQAAAALDTNVRQFERKALDYSGVSPQTMRRVARFTRALRMKSRITPTGARNWADIAHEAGYYDQMHMVREFRILGGAAPTSLVHQIEPHHGTSLLLEEGP